MGNFPSEAESTTPRAEWFLWEALTNHPEAIPRLPTFGDYAVQHPLLPDFDPRMMKFSAAIRYATPTGWLIVKGRNVQDHGAEQYRGLCRTLMGRAEYRGRGFSWGDDYIHRCANGEVGPGNQMTWRRVGTTHHIATVTEQLASFSAS